MSKKKVLFIAKQYFSRDDGRPFPKFNQQISALSNMGYSVSYVAIKQHEYTLCTSTNDTYIKIGREPKHNALYSFRVYSRLYSSIYRWLREVKEHFDFVYIRNMPFDYSACKMFRELRLHADKLVVEIPTYPYEGEINKDKRFWVRSFYKVTANCYNQIFSLVDLFTLIGEKASSFKNKPAINIENGVSLSDIPIQEKKMDKDENVINIVAIGTIAKWHGYERLLMSVSNYNNNEKKRKIYVHFVGDDGDGSLNNLKELTKELKIIDEVVFHGPVYGDELNALFNNMDIAVGSLGFYKCFKIIPSSLKTKEFMARGIPFFMGGEDPIIPSGKYYYKVPNDASIFDLRDILQFYDWFSSDPMNKKRMRDYAAKNLSWEKQFELVIEKLGEDHV